MAGLESKYQWESAELNHSIDVVLRMCECSIVVTFLVHYCLWVDFMFSMNLNLTRVTEQHLREVGLRIIKRHNNVKLIRPYNHLHMLPDKNQLRTLMTVGQNIFYKNSNTIISLYSNTRLKRQHFLPKSSFRPLANVVVNFVASNSMIHRRCCS